MTVANVFEVVLSYISLLFILLIIYVEFLFVDVKQEGRCAEAGRREAGVG